jgi:hypothetical protein
MLFEKIGCFIIYINQAVDLLQTPLMIRRFGTWPVPVISDNRKDGVVLEGPVCKQNQVVGWHTSEHVSKLRRFHVAMSGFAFNSTMLWDPKLRSHLAWNSIRHPDTVNEGFQVSLLFLFSDILTAELVYSYVPTALGYYVLLSILQNTYIDRLIYFLTTMQRWICLFSPL